MSAPAAMLLSTLVVAATAGPAGQLHVPAAHDAQLPCPANAMLARELARVLPQTAIVLDGNAAGDDQRAGLRRDKKRWLLTLSSSDGTVTLSRVLEGPAKSCAAVAATAALIVERHLIEVDWSGSRVELASPPGRPVEPSRPSSSSAGVPPAVGSKDLAAAPASSASGLERATHPPSGSATAPETPPLVAREARQAPTGSPTLPDPPLLAAPETTSTPSGPASSAPAFLPEAGTTADPEAPSPGNIPPGAGTVHHPVPSPSPSPDLPAGPSLFRSASITVGPLIRGAISTGLSAGGALELSGRVGSYGRLALTGHAAQQHSTEVVISTRTRGTLSGLPLSLLANAGLCAGSPGQLSLCGGVAVGASALFAAVSGNLHQKTRATLWLPAAGVWGQVSQPLGPLELTFALRLTTGLGQAIATVEGSSTQLPAAPPEATALTGVGWRFF